MRNKQNMSRNGVETRPSPKHTPAPHTYALTRPISCIQVYFESPYLELQTRFYVVTSDFGCGGAWHWHRGWAKIVVERCSYVTYGLWAISVLIEFYCIKYTLQSGVLLEKHRELST